ncbi:MAG: endo-1,4-beta-xylanase [Ignavibacteriaceae bacterium]
MNDDAYCQLVKGQDKFVGNIIGSSIPSNFTKYWNQVTPENAGKWGNVEIKENVFVWDTLDNIYHYALKHHIPFKFHNLVWGKQQPEWIKDIDPAQQKQQVERWIKLCGERYPKASFVDVVNEPIRTKEDMHYPPYYEAIGGKGKTGWDWVIWSYEQARKCFPHSKLILNEYNILNGRRPIDTLIYIVNLLKERKLIDGIGIQGHFLEETDSADIHSRLDILAKLGLPIYISEYDVNIANDAKQLEKYKEQFPLFWNCKAIKGITLWGYKQNIIWRPNAYLVRADGTERPALKWLKKYLKK